jgi:hypothetical protein
MLRRALVVALVLAGCGSSSEPPSPRFTLAPWTGPSVKLVSAGTPPLEPVRIPLDAASTPASVTWSTAFDTVAKRGLTTSSPSTVRQHRSFDIRSTPGPATVAYDFTVTEARDEQSGGATDAVSVTEYLVGRTGGWVADARCQVQQAGIDTEQAGPVLPQLPGLLRTAVEYCPVLPEEPIGIGARWTLTETTTDGRPRVTEWMLVHRDAQQLALTFQALDATGSTDTLAEGRVGLDRHHPVPIRFDANGRSVRSRPDPTDPSTTIEWTTTWEMHAERTLTEP